MPNKDQLSENIQELTKQVKSSNSYWKYLGRGVLFGIGSAIGASIIAAIIIGTLVKIANVFKDIPGALK